MQDRRPPSPLTRLFLSFSLLIFVILAASPAFAERVEDLPKPTDYVSDFAHVLSPEATARLDRLCGQLDHSKTNTQIAIVTIKTLDGEPIADFASRLEEKWKFGKKGSDRSIIMLFAIQDHKRRIEVGYGLEGILPDARVGEIGDNMIPQLRQGNYDGAVTTGLVQIANVIAADAKVTLQDANADQETPHGAPVRREPRQGVSVIGLVFRIGFVVLILIFFGARGLFGFGLGMLFGGGRGGGWGGGGYGGGGGFDGGGGGGGDSGFSGGGGGESGGGGADGSW